MGSNIVFNSDVDNYTPHSALLRIMQMLLRAHILHHIFLFSTYQPLEDHCRNKISLPSSLQSVSFTLWVTASLSAVFLKFEQPSVEIERG